MLCLISVVSGAVPVATAVAAGAAPSGTSLDPVYPPLMDRGHGASVYLPPPVVAATPSPAVFAPAHVNPSPAARSGNTAFSSWTTDASGHVTRKVFLAPAFRHRGGTWLPIDTTVTPLSDPAFPLSAESALRPIRFGQQASRLLQIELDGGPVTVSASGLSIGRPQAVDHGAKYSDVAADTDLEYEVGPQGVTEKVILRSAQAPHSFTFHIADPKGQLGSAHTQKDGSVRFDGVIDQDAALELTAPFAYEQGSADASTPQAIDPSSAHMTVTPARDGFDVTESVDATWLQGKTFPLVIDPNYVTYNYSNSNTRSSSRAPPARWRVAAAGATRSTRRP